MTPVISDPNAIFSHVVSYTAVAKCTLYFHNLTISGKVEIKQLRRKQFYSINKKNLTKITRSSGSAPDDMFACRVVWEKRCYRLRLVIGYGQKRFIDGLVWLLLTYGFGFITLTLSC